MKRLKQLVVPLSFLAVSLLAGCGPREHIREDFGRIFRQAFAQQRVWPEAATGNPLGLDSEEASVIHATYRNNLSGGKGAGGGDQKVLLLDAAPKK